MFSLSLLLSFSLGSIKDYECVSFLRLPKRFFVSFFAWFPLSSPLILFDSCTCVFIHTVSSDRGTEKQRRYDTSRGWQSRTVILSLLMLWWSPTSSSQPSSSLTSPFFHAFNVCMTRVVILPSFIIMCFMVRVFSLETRETCTVYKECKESVFCFFKERFKEKKKETSPHRKRRSREVCMMGERERKKASQDKVHPLKN